ncbi:MAG: antibiotic biosynthesis monooxygenase family protein [Pseudomonadota bacterium]|nr:antibiotic biosynthesis monooxygenase family protein [Pseudomonadota bacterium]
MSVARHFIMQAGTGKAAALETALRELADKLRRIPGCDDVEVLREHGNQGRFVLREKWASIEAHQQGSRCLGEQDLAPMLSALDALPADNDVYFDYLETH